MGPDVPPLTDAALLAALADMPARIDELTARISASNARLREQVAATRAILAELGISGAVAPAAVPALQPPPAQAPRASSPNAVAEDDPARLEQLRYLATRKAEKEARLEATRNGAIG